jgi:hypothetical protein
MRSKATQRVPRNTSIGVGALVRSTGNDNIAVGAGAGTFLTAGGNNIYGTPQFGLIAEEVVNPDLVMRDEKGDIYTVRYDAVNAMLLNEFLKEHRKVEEQTNTIAELKSTVAGQQKDFQSKLAEQEKQIEVWHRVFKR